MVIVGMYLGAIVAANLSVSAFGPGVSILNAFLFIGLDITSRDRLHEAWSGNGLKYKMAALIAVGGVISWLLNANAASIAIASTASFVIAAVIDSFIFSALRSRPRWERINGSNVASAAADSLVFPTLAFGSLMPAIVVGQFVAKVVGGFIWSLLIR